MEIGNKLYELRKNANLSQEQLAEKLNITRQTISNWELGQTVPDIMQAKEISKIFKITLDELIDNNVKDILVEKISNTEKIVGTTKKNLKMLSIVIIVFLIIVVLINVVYMYRVHKEKTMLEQRQFQEQLYREYMTNIKTRRFYISINNEKYSYIIQYGEDNAPILDTLALISEYNEKAQENYNIYINYILQTYGNYKDVKERINDVKNYFESRGGTWEENSNILM